MCMYVCMFVCACASVRGGRTYVGSGQVGSKEVSSSEYVYKLREKRRMRNEVITIHQKKEKEKTGREGEKKT